MKKWTLTLFIVLLFIGWGGYYKEYFYIKILDADSVYVNGNIVASGNVTGSTHYANAYYLWGIPIINGGGGLMTFNANGNWNEIAFDYKGGDEAMRVDSFGDVNIVNDIKTVAWTDYGGSSSIGGFSGTPTANIWYKKVGNLVFVNFYIDGTSNATTLSFTLPYTNVNSANAEVYVWCRGKDNDAFLNPPAMGLLVPNAATVDLYQNGSGGAWTNANGKSVRGQFWFEAQ